MPSIARPVHIDTFYSDGRGPELIRIHWTLGGRQLVAVDYFNPDDPYDEANLKHVAFLKAQVVMITPEEVASYFPLKNPVM
jgi:uncharacterized protein YfaP (DUF2135 family)